LWARRPSMGRENGVGASSRALTVFVLSLSPCHPPHMPSSAVWWSPSRSMGRPVLAASDRSNPLLLDEEQEGGVVAGASPRTPPSAASPPPPALPLLPLRLRALAAAFRATNTALTLASLAALLLSLLLDRAAHGLVPLALSAAAVGSTALGCLGACAPRTRPAPVATYSAAMGSAVLAEAVLAVALLVAGGHPSKPPPGPTPRPAPQPQVAALHAALLAAGLVAALQVTGLAIASLLLPAASAAEDWQAEAAAAAEGWASPPRWGASSGARRAAAAASTLATPPPASDPDGAAFAARMRDRYGLDPASLAYNPAARSAAWRRESGVEGRAPGRRGAPPPPLRAGVGGRERAGEPESGRACVVM